ncbi:hypothetical protein [Dinoroseobacter sp. S375]|uniref:hypothetical protein n=1 Tax=Dinoroseobacter sp. S375 TaxID=3415136 RepID=UPI003C7C5301
MDPGYVVIGVFVAIVALVIWSGRGKRSRKYPGEVRDMPGRRQEGADFSGGEDP